MCKPISVNDKITLEALRDISCSAWINGSRANRIWKNSLHVGPYESVYGDGHTAQRSANESEGRFMLLRK